MIGLEPAHFLAGALAERRAIESELAAVLASSPGPETHE